MKKFIIPIAIAVVVIIGIVVFILVGGKNKGELFTLTDKYNSLEITLRYPKDAGFTVDEFDENYTTTYPSASFRNVDKNYEVTVNFQSDSVTAYNKDVEYAKEKDNYSEIEYNKYVGYKYVANSFGDIEMNLKLKDTGTSYIVLCLRMEKIESNKDETNLNEIFDSKEFQKILKSLTFTDQVEGKVEEEGVLSDNHKLLVKPIEAPNADYTVNQYQDTHGGVMSEYILNSDKSQYNNSGAYFRVEYYGNEGDYKDLATLQAYREDTFDEKYTDGNLFGTSVKIAAPTSELQSQYSAWDSGIFEKDGEVFQYLYYSYSDVDQSIGEQLVKNVLANIEIKD